MYNDGLGKYCSKRCSNIHNNPSKNKRIPKEVEGKIIEAYLSGLSKENAGKLYGYGRGATDKILKRNAIQIRTISESLKNRCFSDKHKRKISANHRDVSGKNNPMFGKPSTNPNGRGKRVFD